MKKLKTIEEAVELCRNKPEIVEGLPEPFKSVMVRLIDGNSGKPERSAKAGRVAPSPAQAVK